MACTIISLLNSSTPLCLWPRGFKRAVHVRDEEERKSGPPCTRAPSFFVGARNRKRALEILGGGRKRSFRTGSKNITSSWTPRLRRRYNFVVKLIPTPFVRPFHPRIVTGYRVVARERERERERERGGVIHEGCRSIDDNDPVDDSFERYYTRLIDAR